MDAKQRASWDLVERDNEMRSMLKDVRRQMDGYARRVENESQKLRTLAPCKKEEEGTLYVRLERGNGLKAMDSNGSSDPYVKLSLGGAMHRSRTIRRTLNPYFDQIFQFHGTLGELLEEPLLVVVYDYDMITSDDEVGAARVDLRGTYLPLVERPFHVELKKGDEEESTGSLLLQVWWLSGSSTARGGGLSSGVQQLCCIRSAPVPIPTGLRMNAGDSQNRCAMYHPDSRFRSSWNIFLAFFILYCGIAVPLEIAFEADMVDAMCGVGEMRVLRAQCNDFQLWFWGNFLVDIFFMCDIAVNFRTGYVHEGQYISDGRLAA
jgi:hypothetical protein